MSLPEDLRSIGLELVPHGKEFVAACPFHTGGHDSDSVTVGRWKGKWFWKCFACGATGRSLEDWNTATQIMRLRAERDEARRKCCWLVAMIDYLGNPTNKNLKRSKQRALDHMHGQGWDCLPQEDGNA